MQKYVVRVDDVGQGEDQSTVDTGLANFLRWYEPWRGTPMYLGCVPACFGKCELAALADVDPTLIAIHGWDHAKRDMTAQDLAKGRLVFPASSVVVPPYNLYGDDLLDAMGQGWTLLGGFHGQDHEYGREPVRVGGGCIHASAVTALYARSWDVVSNIKRNLVPVVDYLLQLVLHWRWEAGKSSEVLAELVKPYMVRVDALHEYADRHR
jgi:hypothetical protein